MVRKALRKPFEAEFKILQHIDFDGRCAVDVGANRGQSIDAIRLFHPSAEFVCFEPNPVLAARLRRRYSADANLRIESCGLGTRDANLDLFVPFYRGFMYDGLASFDEGEAGGWLNARTVWNFDPRKLSVQTHACRVRRLDDYDLRPAFVKIDVQGFEEQVLDGGARTLRESRPVLLIENNSGAARTLADWGWTRFAYLSGILVQDAPARMNMIFLHSSAPDHRVLRAKLRT